jgi:hypothetical protein
MSPQNRLRVRRHHAPRDADNVLLGRTITQGVMPALSRSHALGTVGLELTT